MKFRIRFADQIVGLFIIAALVSIVFVIIMLGRSQRWFSRDTYFNTELVSATGLGKNMPVLYKGFTIGNVESFNLNENDNVEVVFFIYEEYRDRVKYGSLVEVMASPIGLGNQFLFHPGNGDFLVADGDFIPSVGTKMASDLIKAGLAAMPQHDDSISLLLNRASSLLGVLDEALRTGTSSTELGQIISSIRLLMAGMETLPDTIVSDIDTVLGMVDNALAALAPIVTDIGVVTSMLAAPDGTVAAILDSDGEVYTGLAGSLSSLAGIMNELDKTAAFIPSQLPQIAGLITDLRVALKTAEDVLVALTNNPLLRKGIPDTVEVQSSGTSPRDIQF